MAGFLKNRTRKRLLEQAFVGRQQLGNGLQRPVFPDLRSMKKLGILYKLECQEDLNKLEELVSWAGGKGIAVEIVAVETGKCFKDDILRHNFAEEFEGRCSGSGVKVCFVGKKDLNGIGVPQSEKVGSFLQQKMDILVLLDDEGNFTLEYLALSSEAAFVVGMDERSAVLYNMVLAQTGKAVAPAEYMQQLFDYLEKMNCNGE